MYKNYTVCKNTYTSEMIKYSMCEYSLVSPVSYSLSRSSSKMSTSSLPVVERLLERLMLSFARVMASRSPRLHSIGSSSMAAETQFKETERDPESEMRYFDEHNCDKKDTTEIIQHNEESRKCRHKWFWVTFVCILKCIRLQSTRLMLFFDSFFTRLTQALHVAVLLWMTH